MKIELEDKDIEQIAQKVVEMLKPMLSVHQDVEKAMKIETIYGHSSGTGTYTTRNSRAL